MKCFTQHGFFFDPRLAKIFQKFVSSPKTDLYIFFYFFKKAKKREKISSISMAPQEMELDPRNQEPRDFSPKAQTFRHLVISSLPCSHTKSRRTLSQNLAGTLPSPEVSTGFGFDLEQPQGVEAQQEVHVHDKTGSAATGQAVGTDSSTPGAAGHTVWDAVVC